MGQQRYAAALGERPMGRRRLIGFVAVAGTALALVACGGAATTTVIPAAAPASSAAPAVTPSAAASAASSVAAPAAKKVNANTATVAELQAAFEVAGISNAAKWAREVEEYRPYPTNDPTFAKLRGELAKYNPGPGVVDQIVAVLTLQ